MFDDSNKCASCGAYAQPNMTHCAVCGKFMPNSASGATANTAYVIVDHKRLRNGQVFDSFKRLLWILALVSVGVNIFTIWGSWNIREWWSFYFVASVIIVQAHIFHPVAKRQYYWTEVFLQLWTGLAFLLFVDWYSDLAVSWSLSYVFPMVFAAFAITISLIIAIRSKSDPGNSLLVLLTIFLFSVGLFLFGVLLLPKLVMDYDLLPTFIAMVISFFIFVFFSTFKFKDFTKTLFKRFHI